MNVLNRHYGVVILCWTAHLSTRWAFSGWWRGNDMIVRAVMALLLPASWINSWTASSSGGELYREYIWIFSSSTTWQRKWVLFHVFPKRQNVSNMDLSCLNRSAKTCSVSRCVDVVLQPKCNQGWGWYSLCHFLSSWSCICLAWVLWSSGKK